MHPATALALLLASAIAAGVHILTLRGQLPPEMASHFNGQGLANGWMPRDAFLGIYAGAIVFLTLMMAFLGSNLRKYPDDKISLPNKAVWLSPRHREETFDWMSAWFRVFGAGTNALLIWVMHLAAKANLNGTQRIDLPVWEVVGPYVVFAIVLVIWMNRRFRSVPEDSPRWGPRR